MKKGKVELEDLELMELRDTDGHWGRSELLWRIPRVGEFLWLPECEASFEKVVRVVRVIYDLRRTKVLLDVEEVAVNPPSNWPKPVEQS